MISWASFYRKLRALLNLLAAVATETTFKGAKTETFLALFPVGEFVDNEDFQVYTSA